MRPATSGTAASAGALPRHLIYMVASANGRPLHRAGCNRAWIWILMGSSDIKPSAAVELSPLLKERPSAAEAKAWCEDNMPKLPADQRAIILGLTHSSTTLFVMFIRSITCTSARRPNDTRRIGRSSIGSCRNASTQCCAAASPLLHSLHPREPLVALVCTHAPVHDGAVRYELAEPGGRSVPRLSSQSLSSL